MFYDNFTKKSEIWDNGWHKQAKKIISPNFNLRPYKTKIYLIIIHCISLPECQYNNTNVEDFFQNKLVPYHKELNKIKKLKVSSHFYINRDGELIQFVSTENRAWHAGKSFYKGKDNCNDFSIGIELQGSVKKKFMNIQYETLVKLTKNILQKYPNIGSNIVGHDFVSPERKEDPGKYFEWNRYLKLIK